MIGMCGWLGWCLGCVAPEAAPEREVYRQVEQATLMGDLYVPKGRGPFPAVVLVPGGAFMHADIGEAGLVRWAERLQEEGYVAFAVRYRVQEDFSESPSFPAPVEDIACAVRWLRGNAAERRVDGDRIAVMGSSAGGHLVTMLGLGAGDAAVCGAADAERTEVRGVVDFYGPVDWTSIRAQRGNRLITAERDYVGSPCTGPDDPMCVQASYMPWISPEAPPFFVAHSADDPNIPVQQSLELVASLEENGRGVEWREVDGLEHGWWGDFDKPAAAEVRDAVLVWLDGLIGR